ncbi:hypothetical protein Tco_1163808 [Tanacetum coccineum]
MDQGITLHCSVCPLLDRSDIGSPRIDDHRETGTTFARLGSRARELLTMRIVAEDQPGLRMLHPLHSHTNYVLDTDSRAAPGRMA